MISQTSAEAESNHRLSDAIRTIAYDSLLLRHARLHLLSRHSAIIDTSSASRRVFLPLKTAVIRLHFRFFSFLFGSPSYSYSLTHYFAPFSSAEESYSRLK